MINFYQLIATGRDKLEHPVKIASKKIFTSKEEAELYIPEFSQLAKGDGHKLTDIHTQLDVHIIELELIENDN